MGGSSSNHRPGRRRWRVGWSREGPACGPAKSRFLAWLGTTKVRGATASLENDQAHAARQPYIPFAGAVTCGTGGGMVEGGWRHRIVSGNAKLSGRTDPGKTGRKVGKWLNL